MAVRGLIAICAVSLALVVHATQAGACETQFAARKVMAPDRIGSAANAASWFVEFRARNAVPAGHAYAVLGVTTRTGRDRILRIASFYPRDGFIGTIGSITGYPGELGYKLTDQATRAVVSFRRNVSANLFRKLERVIEQRAANPGRFTAFQRNCNEFVGQLARMVGLKTPASTAMHSPDYMRALVALNRRRKQAD
ncbi:hypothetical protein ACKTEK_11405 [Tepidamorphus sp. 3E244]|uniref:hypothetical protein n=1 Tax=Tepidamorphus sp. 3E244 TaxID=3385498 RepID=UPI0038FC8EDC